MINYDIPLKNKPILSAHSDSTEVFNYTYTHNKDANELLHITNPNSYSIEVVFSLNAGSGDTNYSGYESARRWDSNIYYTQYLYNHAGRSGTNVVLRYENKLLLSVSGGSGTPAGSILQQRNIHRWTSRGGGLNSRKTYQNESIGAWSARNNIDNRSEGESAMYILTLKPTTSVQVEFIHNNATNAPFKGSVTISGVC